VSLWVVVGGQYGSEGKGKLAAFIAQNEEIDICVRCGGPNSGHSLVALDGSIRILRQLPTGFVRPKTRLLIPAGGLINLALLKAESKAVALDSSRLGIDRNAMLILEQDRLAEKRLRLGERLSSTLCGVGSATSRRVLRGQDVVLAREAAKKDTWLARLLTSVSDEVNSALDSGKRVLIEGTQGFGLSLYHSCHYPHTTSRDTSAAGFISEVGVSPLRVTEIVAVFRTFPIRVAGEQAGPLENEITWEILQRESGYPYPICEYTTVTQKKRRIGRFDWKLSKSAVLANCPTRLAINGLDYIDYANRGKSDAAKLTPAALAFLQRLETEFRVPVAYIGTGPAADELIYQPSAITDEVVSNVRHWGVGELKEVS
jgi:adenylosuccinate synthase